MPQRTIKTNDLTTRAQFLVRGKIGWSQITHVIDGEELTRDQETRRRRGWPTIDKPYTRISLYEATVVCANPNVPTLEEKYAMESMFESKSPNSPGMNYSVTNKSKMLPRVGMMQSDGTVALVMPEGELALGLDVTLVMTVYDPGSGKNKGVGLSLVILNEPIKYRSARSVDLSGYGLKFVSDPTIEAAYQAKEREMAANAPATAQPVAGAAQLPYQGQPAAQPAAQPAPAAAPAAVPGYQPFSTGVQAQPAAQPAQTGALPYQAQPAQPAQPAAPAGGVVPGYPGATPTTPYDPSQDPNRMY